jgi:hypothetical protein
MSDEGFEGAGRDPGGFDRDDGPARGSRGGG